MIRWLIVIPVLGFASVLPLRLSLRAEPASAQQAASKVDFARDVQPLLEKHCYECHGPRKSRGSLRLHDRRAALKGGESGAVILPGDSERSLVVRRLLGLDGEDRMPKDKDPLAAAEIALIRAWIDQGAAWPETTDAAAPASAGKPAADAPQHWAYRPPSRVEVPVVGNAAWSRNAVDRFVLARLEKEGLAPSPEAPLETLVRRVSLDLIGLPPSLKEVDDTLQDAKINGRDAAYERLVDRLLASPHYGERWARPWLDLARYADSHGFEKDLPRVMWKYRDWVIDALNRDMPFDRFTIEQIAGDLLPNATIEQRIASGFHRNAMTNEEGGIDPEEAHYEVLVDRVNTTATVWLGTTLGCAQCHNHKYDPFTQKDYFRMMAFFQNSDYEVRRLGDGTKFFESMIDVPTPDQEAARKKIQAEIDTLTERTREQTPELDRAQAAWEETMRLAPSTAWTAIVPKTIEASSHVVLTAARDGSLTASGPNPGQTVYSIEGIAALPRITAIRLEALPDPSLPKGGPGRDVYGNFQLNGFEAASRRGSSDWSVHGFKAIKADDSSGGASLETFFPKTLSRDAYAPRGWRIDASREETRLPRQIVFTLERPLIASTPAGMRLRIRLSHLSTAAGQALGRFRLSVTSSPQPQKVLEVTARLRPILTIAPAKRTEQQRKDLATLFRNVAPSLKPTRDRITQLQKDLKALGIPTALVMKERVEYERPSAYIRRRGSFLDKGEKVYAGVPEELHALREDQMPNRLGLARWLVDERNPLTTRVAINRAWEQFFGRGLVETSEDFGTQGARPSHPELLDWLATELVGQGWHMKALHKLIVMSATYRQTSNASAALLERDPYNRLLARGARFRMEAEMVRDAALAASGLLTRRIGGPSVFPPQPEGIWDIPYSSEKWVQSEGADRYRRGLYTFIRRSATYPSLMTFDATSREFCTVRRVRTNTPLQALTTLNDDAFFEAARALAWRLMVDTGGSRSTSGRAMIFDNAGAEARWVLAKRAIHAFRLVATRTPTDVEVEQIIASYTKQLERFRNDPAAAARVTGEHAISSGRHAEQAAWTLVANALLNLDEALTKQ